MRVPREDRNIFLKTPCDLMKNKLMSVSSSLRIPKCPLPAKYFCHTDRS